MKTDFQDRIDEYILGRMSDEEKAQFEAEINQDASKRRQLELTRNVKIAITSREDKLARMRNMQRMYDREHRQVAASMRATGTEDFQYASAPQDSERRSSRRIWWWASGIAAVFVIGLFVINPFGSDTLQMPSGASPSYDGRPDELMRGEENDIFEMETPIMNDSIKNEAIPPRDTVIVEEKIDVVNE